MNALKSLLAVSVLTTAGVACASTVQTYTVTSTNLNPAIFNTIDSSGNPLSYNLAISGGATGTGTLDSSGALTLNMHGETVLDVSFIFGKPTGSYLSDTITNSALVLNTTGSYNLNETGSTTTTNSCSNGPQDGLGACESSSSSHYSLIGPASYYSGQGFTLSGGTFNLITRTIYDTYITTQYVLTPSVPVPAAAWLFGSSLIGLTGLTRKYKAV